MGFPLGLLDIVANYVMVEGIIPELMILALVDAVRCFWLRNRQHSKILCGFNDSNCFLFLHGVGVDDGGTGRRLVASL